MKGIKGGTPQKGREIFTGTNRRPLDHVPTGNYCSRSVVEARERTTIERIESRHNEADYRKVVHEYVESGEARRKDRESCTERVELTSLEISLGRDRLHDDESREPSDLRAQFNQPIANLR